MWCFNFENNKHDEFSKIRVILIFATLTSISACSELQFLLSDLLMCSLYGGYGAGLHQEFPIPPIRLF